MSEIEVLRARCAEQARQLQILQEAQREKNLALDAMFWVWCNGGCRGGVLRWEPGELTEEIVALAERNTKRLRSWLTNRIGKERYAAARAAGLSFEDAVKAMQVSATKVPEGGG